MCKEEGEMSSGMPKKRTNKGGAIVRFEPRGMALINSNPNYMETFRKAGCLNFFENFQGGHNQVTNEFALHFSGSNTKIGILNYLVTPETIALVTKIPRGQ